MAGLLDFGIEDPDQKQAANMGLLSLGLRLMSTPGKFGQALGQSGMGALGDYQQALQQGQAAKMQKLQMQQHQIALQQAQQQQADQERQRAWLQGLQSPQMKASQAALAGGGGPTAANAAAMPKVDPVQQMMFDGVKAGALPLGTYLQSLQKDETPITLAEGAKLITKSGKELASNPKPVQEDDFIKNMRAAGIDPSSPYGQGLIRNWLATKSTHAPAVSVSYGAPVAGQDAAGNPVFFQPAKDGGQPSIIPGVKPEGKAQPVELAKSVAGLKELQNGIATYEKTIDELGGPDPFATGKKRAALQSAFTSLQMGLKNALELGALAGPDISILNGMLVDPTSPRATLIGPTGIKEQANGMKKYLRNRGTAVFEAHKLPVPSEFQSETTAPAGAPMAGTIKDGYRFKGGNPADAKNWEKL